MKQQNLVSAKISADDIQAVQAAIATIRQRLPFLIGLTPELRQSLLKMGQKSRDFVGRALEVAPQNLDSLPRGLDVNEARQDLALRDALVPLNQALSQLSEMMTDTELAAGSDAYTSALVVYQSLKMAGKSGGLDETLDDLGQRFAKKLTKAKAAT